MTGKSSEISIFPLIVVTTSSNNITDTTKIVFYSEVDNAIQLFMIKPDGTSKEKLPLFMENSNEPSWSPHGHRIAFETETDGNLEIFVIHADGSNKKRD